MTAFLARLVELTMRRELQKEPDPGGVVGVEAFFVKVPLGQAPSL